MTDLAIAFEAANPDRLAAFETLMRRYERLVLVTALRLLGNLPDAQDAAQEVFFRMYRNWDRIRDPEACASWLYRVTVNVCYDQRRKRPVSSTVDEAWDVAAPDPDPQERMMLSERQYALQQVLSRLPEKERAALVLRDLEGLSTAEAAAALGTTEATVRSQAARARIKIRESVERFFRRRS